MPDDLLIRRIIVWAAIAIAMTLFVIQSISLRGYVSSDFHIFYDAAARSVSDFTAIYKAEWNADVKTDVGTLQGYLYPPPSILVFMPLVLAEKPEAFAIFSILALLAAVVSIAIWLSLLQRYRLVVLARSEWVALIMLACVTAPVFINRGGQVGTFLLALCVFGVAFGNGRWGWVGGALLALGGWIKIYPGLLVFAMPLRKDWPRAASGFIAASIAIPFLSLIVIPIEMYRQYFSTLLPAMSGRAIINIDNQSFAAVWLRLQDTGFDPRTSFAALPIPNAISAAFVIGALSIMAAFFWRTRNSEAALLPVTAVIMALIGPLAPLGWGHSYTFMLPLLVMVMAMAWNTRRAGCGLSAIAAWAIIVVPSHSRLPDGLLPAFAEQIFYARYPIAVFILLIAFWRLCNTAALKPEHDRPICAVQPMEVS